MKKLQVLFTALRAGGLIGILLLFIRVEYMFVHANISYLVNPLIQFFAVASMLILPLCWILIGAAFVGHFGRRAMKKRIEQAAGEVETGD